MYVGIDTLRKVFLNFISLFLTLSYHNQDRIKNNEMKFKKSFLNQSINTLFVVVLDLKVTTWSFCQGRRESS